MNKSMGLKNFYSVLSLFPLIKIIPQNFLIFSMGSKKAHSVKSSLTGYTKVLEILQE